VPQVVESVRALVFDAYGTLFDVRAVTDSCAGIAVEPARFVALWRAKQLEYAFLRSLMRRYEDFWSITRAALRYAAAATDTQLSAEQEDGLMESWFRVAPFTDVEPALHALVGHNLLLAILSNGAPDMLTRLVTATRLDGYFRALLSVDSVRVYKPDPAVYVLAERALSLPRDELLFVSSNFGMWPGPTSSACGSVGSTAMARGLTSLAFSPIIHLRAWLICRRWSLIENVHHTSLKYKYYDISYKLFVPAYLS
jgi:2-haloacid dehalogenase